MLNFLLKMNCNSLIVWRVLILNWFYVWMDKKDLHSFETLWSLIMQIEFILDWNNVISYFKSINRVYKYYLYGTNIFLFYSLNHLPFKCKKISQFNLKPIYLFEQNKYHFDLFAMIVIKRLWPITKSIILNHHFLAKWIICDRVLLLMVLFVDF